MSDLKETQEKPLKISWAKSVLYPSKEYIEAIARGGIKLEPLRNPKILILIYWAFSLLFSFYVVSMSDGIEREMIHRGILYHTWADMLFALSYEIPTVYLIVRNYRAGYIIFALFAITMKLLPVLSLDRKPASALLFCFLYATISITGVRILSAKIKFGTSPKRSKLQFCADIAVPLLSFALLLILSLVLYYAFYYGVQNY
ncbi:MAG: hypothetical protein LBH29_03035 [Elusimicrobiota bacterium]|jgi:hypothetical protein|nr:hypothetical protein [Elusimicrobiota bacterium]